MSIHFSIISYLLKFLMDILSNKIQDNDFLCIPITNIINKISLLGNIFLE